DNGGGIPPVPPADDNGGDDGDDNGGHDGENGGENGGDDGDPPAPPVINLTIKATSATLAQGANVAGAGMLVQINTGDPSQVPGDTGAIPDDSGSADGELSGTTDANGELQLEVPAAVAAALGGTLLNIDTTPYSGLVMTFAGEVDAASVLPGELMPYVQQAVMFGGNTYIPLLIPEAMVAGLQGLIDSANTLGVEINICIDPKPLSDPYFGTRGSWEQPYPDQWAIQRVGFTQRDSAWDLVKPKGEPVIVAVVDSGLDWNHREIDWDSLWRNPGEVPGNGIDDDNNGYIDDTIGWDFWDNDRKPWDNDGHGTFVAGVMFANPDNGEGIAGVARHARLMVLKAMNAFGHTRATSVAQAIKYAADNGARVINLSLGGPESSTVVREAIDYAHGKNAVVVVAAGNEAVPAENQSVAGLPNALTVAATGYDDTRSVYSNYGAGIDLAAPGDDILSLRARRTDLLKNLPGVDYETESAFVGEDRRYYRASGTSFAAPIVSGVAALVIANNPELSADEVMRVLKQSANDVETTGVDHFTGYGIVDAAAALKADPDVYVEASISGVTVAEREGAQALLVNGAMGADRFEKATISIGKGENPDEWEQITMLKKPINGELTGIPATRFAGAKVWIIRLQVEHKNGQTREFRFRLALG
ncbi:MAG: S8 family serine peptidase, partial [Halioglobus sp.]|nr:S8 family serine peptidase [Halioglobus sp.]